MLNKLSIGFSSLAGLLLTSSAFAAADADVVGAATTTIDTLKENILGVISANIANIAIVAAAIIGIFVVYKLLRRMVGR